MGYVFAAIGVAVVAFVWWRYTSVARGMRQRDQRLVATLDPIAQRLERKEHVSIDEVAGLAREPQFRPMLYSMLKHHERLDLFPQEHQTTVAQGEGILAYWMMHPNELAAAPEAMQLVEEVERDGGDGRRLKCLVYRFRMPPGHWESRSGWILGVAGPFLDHDVPYSGKAMGFARCGDVEGKIKPDALVDWWLDVLKSKGA